MIPNPPPAYPIKRNNTPFIIVGVVLLLLLGSCCICSGLVYMFGSFKVTTNGPRTTASAAPRRLSNSDRDSADRTSAAFHDGYARGLVGGASAAVDARQKGKTIVDADIGGLTDNEAISAQIGGRLPYAPGSGDRRDFTAGYEVGFRDAVGQ